MEDKFVWMNLMSDIFSVKPFYSSFSNGMVEVFLLVMFGILGCHRGLVLSHGKLHEVGFLLYTNSKRRGWMIPNRCYMCEEEEEMTGHILLHCSKAVILWQLIYSPFGVYWVIYFLVRCLFVLAWVFCQKEQKKA